MTVQSKSPCLYFLKFVVWDFPGSPVVKTSPSNAGGVGSIPGQEAEIPHALWPKNQNIKQKQYCNKFNKDFKYGLHQKKSLKENLLYGTNCFDVNSVLNGVWSPLPSLSFILQMRTQNLGDLLKVT